MSNSPAGLLGQRLDPLIHAVRSVQTAYAGAWTYLAPLLVDDPELAQLVRAGTDQLSLIADDLRLVAQLTGDGARGLRMDVPLSQLLARLTHTVPLLTIDDRTGTDLPLSAVAADLVASGVRLFLALAPSSSTPITLQVRQAAAAPTIRVQLTRAIPEARDVAAWLRPCLRDPAAPVPPRTLSALRGHLLAALVPQAARTVRCTADETLLRLQIVVPIPHSNPSQTAAHNSETVGSVAARLDTTPLATGLPQLIAAASQRWQTRITYHAIDQMTGLDERSVRELGRRVPQRLAIGVLRALCWYFGCQPSALLVLDRPQAVLPPPTFTRTAPPTGPVTGAIVTTIDHQLAPFRTHYLVEQLQCAPSTVARLRSDDPFTLLHQTTLARLCRVLDAPSVDAVLQYDPDALLPPVTDSRGRIPVLHVPSSVAFG